MANKGARHLMAKGPIHLENIFLLISDQNSVYGTRWLTLTLHSDIFDHHHRRRIQSLTSSDRLNHGATTTCFGMALSGRLI